MTQYIYLEQFYHSYQDDKCVRKACEECTNGLVDPFNRSQPLLKTIHRVIEASEVEELVAPCYYCGKKLFEIIPVPTDDWDIE